MNGVIRACAVLAVAVTFAGARAGVAEGDAQPAEVRLIGGADTAGLMFDFGRALMTGPAIEHVFKLHAQDGRPVAVDRVQAGCGCTSAVVDAQAGGTGDIAVRVAVDPSHLSSGHISKSVLVYIKGQAAPAATLEMTGTVESGIDVKPDRVDFGVVPAGVSRECVLDVTLAPELAVTSLSLVAHAPGVTISALPEAPGPRRYRATLSATAAIGEVQGTIAVTCSRTINATGEPVSISIPVTGRVQGAISVNPAIVVFGATAHGQRVVRSITLTADTPATLQSIRLTSDDPHVSARLVKPHVHDGTASSAQLDVAVEKSISASAVAAHITITAASGQHIIVPVYADVVPE